VVIYFAAAAAAAQYAPDYCKSEEGYCDCDDTLDGCVTSYLHGVAYCGGCWDLSDCEPEVQSTLKLELTHDLFDGLFDDEEKR